MFHNLLHLFSDNIHAIYDVKFMGYHLLREVFDTYHAIVRQSCTRNQEKPTPRPHLDEYYNVDKFHMGISDLKNNATARIFNSMIDALNADECLPQYLIIALDKDILYDLSEVEFGISKNLSAILNWLTRKIDIAVRRKRCQINDRKPGAIGSQTEPTIIYIDMIQRIGIPKDNQKLRVVCDLRFKFNSILHKAVNNQGHLVMSIRSCTTAGHFDGAGNLSNRGKITFWHEVDDLLSRFDKNKVKLLPHLHEIQKEQPAVKHCNPTTGPVIKPYYNNCNSYYSRDYY